MALCSPLKLSPSTSCRKVFQPCFSPFLNPLSSVVNSLPLLITSLLEKTRRAPVQFARRPRVSRRLPHQEVYPLFVVWFPLFVRPRLPGPDLSDH